MARVPLLPLLLVLATLLPGHSPPPAGALRCYACLPADTSELSLLVRLALKSFPLCDNFNPRRPKDHFIMDCVGLSNACLKRKSLRTCYVTRHKEDRCKKDKCTCTTDLCNGSPSCPAAAGWLMMMSLGTAALRGGLQLW